MPFTQTNRQIRITTPLGTDRLLLLSFKGKEALSQPFEYRAELLSEDAGIDPQALLGQRVGIELDLTEGGVRHFDAFVKRFTLRGQHGELTRYRAELRPWLWFLTLTQDCRIYQKRSVPEILRELFEENGFGDYELRLSHDYRKRDYCVQYRESDFNFVSRLMEEEGIYYYFSHSPGKHTLMLCDSPGAHPPLNGGEELPYAPPAGPGGRRGREGITRWRTGKTVRSGNYVHTDYDFTKPRAMMQALAPWAREHPHSRYEVFDYPGLYQQLPDGEAYARTRIEELQADHQHHKGESDARRITLGERFTLQRHPRQEQNREYLITAVRYKLYGDSYVTLPQQETKPTYRCKFQCFDNRESFRPARTTAKPAVKGPQTAVVVGPQGEEIHTDEHGRVKVQFHWDRYGKSDANSSCWVRVTQVWAGKNWGGIQIPRIGQEVIVDFLEGDPDRPIITGRVYNADQMPPWELPANKTQSGILSRSSKGGTPANANAIRFEDKKGEEQLWLHAEKDQLTEVEHDEDKWVGNDRRKTIDGNETTTVHKNRTETVDQDETIHIGNNRNETVTNNETITVGVNRSETVGSDENIFIGSNRSVLIGSNKSETIGISKVESIGLAKALSIGGGYQVTVGAVMNETVGAAKAMEVAFSLIEMVGRNRRINVGKSQTTNIKEHDTHTVGKRLVIDAGDSITIKTGDASITMKKNGTIQIKGKGITINDSGRTNLKARKNVVIKGKKILQN